MTDTRFDDVIVLSKEDIDYLAVGGYVFETADGEQYELYGDEEEAREAEQMGMNALWVGPRDIELLRGGGSPGYATYEVSLIHEDDAGTPKSREAAAERMFEIFQEEEGRARNVAQEAIHVLGYEVRRDVEYTLVDTSDD